MIEQVLNFAPLVWAALWLLHAWAAPTKQGSANETSMLWIKRAKTEEMWDGTLTRFAYVQEKGEFRVYKIGAVMVGSIISLCLFLAFDMAPEIFAILSLFGFAAGELLVRQFPQIDYAGHGAEIRLRSLNTAPARRLMNTASGKQIAFGVNTLAHSKRLSAGSLNGIGLPILFLNLGRVANNGREQNHERRAPGR